MPPNIGARGAPRLRFENERAAPTVNPADRAVTLERERRWMRPAGIAAIAGVLLLLIGLVLRIGALNADGAADALLKVEGDDLGGKLLISAIFIALGFLCLGFPLTHIFLAARDRSERVRSGLVGLAIIGVASLAISGVMNSIALSSAADDFVASEAERAAEESSGAADAAAEKRDTKPGELGATEGKAAGQGSAADGAGAGAAAAEGETTVEPTTTTTETSASDSDEDDAEDAEDAADDRAEDAITDASGYNIGAILGLLGSLAFGIGYFYTSLWGMRTGLLTRFWGSLGMACAVIFVLIAQSRQELLFFQELWFLATGMMLLGVWFGGRPPAWESGTAIPWPKPGQDASRTERDAIEGEGRDVTGEPLDPDEPGSQDGPPPSGGGPPKRKRKRRK